MRAIRAAWAALVATSVLVAGTIAATGQSAKPDERWRFNVKMGTDTLPLFLDIQRTAQGVKCVAYAVVRRNAPAYVDCPFDGKTMISAGRTDDGAPVTATFIFEGKTLVGGDVKFTRSQPKITDIKREF